MADLDFDSFDDGTTPGRAARLGHAMNMVGAACSVALIIGLGVWGYKLAVRDVNGVPVMRALGGPMRITPNVPGGDVALHQGLSVNAVAAVGMAGSLPDQVLLAPAPVDLTLEDLPGLGLDVLAAPDVSAAPLDPVTLSAPLALAEEPVADTDAAVALALADALAEGVAPFEEVAPEAQIEVGGAAPQSSPRPKRRSTPGEVDQASPTLSAVQDVSSVPAPAEIDPGTLAVGTRLVQLGAFDDDAGARAEWARLQGQFGDLMSVKSLVVQAAQSGGRTFYRLRAHGFADEDDARRFCAALVAENTPCIPALHR